MKAREWAINDHLILVDEEDYPVLSRFTWHIRQDKKTFYAYTNAKLGGKNTQFSMHRLITGLVSSEIDHRNRNGLDNRKANLRHATAQQNQCNRQRKNTSGYRGVYKPKRTPKYSIQIQANGKKIHKHGFATKEDAARAYDELSKEMHGEFGIRNFKD